MASEPIIIQAHDSEGDFAAGAKVYFYEAGTTTPQAAFAEAALETPLSNPASADAYGRLIAWLDAGKSYKIAVRDSDGVELLLPVVDNYDPREDNVFYIWSQAGEAETGDASDIAFDAEGLTHTDAETVQGAIEDLDAAIGGESTAILDGDFTTNGLMVRTGAGAYASRSVTAGTGVQVTNGTGAAGNIAVALSSGAQGSLSLADSAIQPGDLATVATSGDYDDLSGKPTLGTMAAETAADYTPTSGLGAAALSNDYGDLANLPTLGDMAAKDEVAVADIDATGSPGETTYLRGDGAWATPAGGGGSVDTTGSPENGDFARFTDSDTIEGLSPSEVRAALDLEPGTDFYSVSAADNAFQPLDSDLTAIAGLTTTSFGRGLLETADAAGLRTAINVEDGATADQSGAEIAASIDIENATARTAFASGDKLLIWEAGVGNRQIDFDDLPGAGGGLTNIVDDTSPQLGGNLDLNGFVITGLEIGSDIQAYSANLATWSGVAPSANGQSLVAAANYAAMRALLDLEPGTDFYSVSGADAAFQPLAANLTALAGYTVADEDDMSSDSATALATQQSIKAYVDAEIAGVETGAGEAAAAAAIAAMSLHYRELTEDHTLEPEDVNAQLNAQGGINSITLPASTVHRFNPGWSTKIKNLKESGSVEIVAATGGPTIAIRSAKTVLENQYDAAVLTYAGENVWDLEGQLAEAEEE